MKYILTSFLFSFSIFSFSQVSYSSSSSTYYKNIDGKKVAFTIVKSSDNGNESQRCILNNFIDIDCEIVANCFNKNNCNEVKKILKKEEKNQKENNVKNIDKSEIFINLRTNKSEMFVGEQLSAISEIYIKKGINIQNTNISPISYDGFWEDEIKINTNKRKQKVIDGINYTLIKFRHSVLTTQKAGTLTIPATNMEVGVQKRGRLISKHPFFGNQYETVLTTQNIKTSTKEIKVRELPEPKPKNFYGIVSENFKIKNEIDRTNLKTSEAISYKVTFRGEGNINMLEPFNIKFPNSFEVFDPIITDKTYTGNHSTGGKKTFEYILIPREKGNFIIPKISFNYFNPKTEKYITINSKSYNIEVKQGKEYSPTSHNSISMQKLELLQYSGFTSITFRKAMKKWYKIIFWTVLSSILLWILVFYFLSKRTINTKEFKRRKSTKIAIKRLKNARIRINNGDFDMFFEETEKSLWGYFSDKFSISQSELSKETVEYYFKKNNIENSLKNRFIELLNICEFARYAPENNKNQQMEETLEKAKEIIIEVEGNIKKK